MSRLALRILTAIWALWFGAALIEPAALETCPTHGAHGGHGMSMPEHAASHSGGSKHGTPAQHTCTCLGACCCAPTVAAPRTKVAELPGEVIAVHAMPRFAPPSGLPHDEPHLGLPPAIGPPTHSG